MPSPARVASLALAVALVAAQAACGGGRRGVTSTSNGSVAPERTMTLQVRNDAFLDHNVFLVAGGTYQRLGFVTGNGGSTRIVVREHRIPPGAQVQFVASAVGARTSASTGPINVRAGDVVEFRIGTVPAQSSVFIR